VKNFILNMVRRLRPVAVEAGVEAAPQAGVDQQIFAELRRIREILESK